MFNISHRVIPDAYNLPRVYEKIYDRCSRVESLIEDDTEIEIFTTRRTCHLELRRGEE